MVYEDISTLMVMKYFNTCKPRLYICILESNEKHPVFVINAVLLIPKVGIKPNLEEVQDVLVLAGKNITSVAKGVGQWTGGKPQVSTLCFTLTFSI